jgi:hypothetical protein
MGLNHRPADLLAPKHILNRKLQVEFSGCLGTSQARIACFTVSVSCEDLSYLRQSSRQESPPSQPLNHHEAR